MMFSAVVIILLRLVAAVLFAWLLGASVWIKLRRVALHAEIRQVRIALILLWAYASADTGYRLWIWLDLIRRGAIPDAEAAPLTMALLAFLAAVASTWALKPWRQAP